MPTINTQRMTWKQAIKTFIRQGGEIHTFKRFVRTLAVYGLIPMTVADTLDVPIDFIPFLNIPTLTLDGLTIYGIYAFCRITFIKLASNRQVK